MLRGWVKTNSGHVPKQDDKLPCGFTIGKWLDRQREQLRNQRLEGDQICALDNAAPGWRSRIDLSSESLQKRPIAIELERENTFADSLSQAAAFVAKHGRLPRRRGMGDTGYRIANWISDQRKSQSRGTLSIERTQHLDHSLPGWRKADILDGRERRWQDALAGFVARVKELGRLPTKSDPSAKWMYYQRTSLKHGRLNEGRLRALNEAVPRWNNVSCRPESEHRTDVCDSTDKPAVTNHERI